MRRFTPTRSLRSALVVGVTVLFGAMSLPAQIRRINEGSVRADREIFPQVRQSPAPIERRPPPSQQQQEQSQQNGQPASTAQPGSVAARDPQFRGPRGEHLAQWMNLHSNLTPDQQQRALEHEPGFQQLPQQTQQRMRDRLAQLDAMPPQQRQRLLANTEVMEHLSLDQRAEVRSALQQLGSLPLEQRRAVARSFRELRGMPADQRAAAVTSSQYGWMNESQHAALNHLLQVEPLLPPQDQQQR